MTLDSDIRKAAILIASLDRASADALIDQLPAAEARRVLQAVVALGEINPDEQDAVIEEFCAVGRPARPIDQSGIELSDNLARRFAVDRPSPVAAAAAKAPGQLSEAPRFSFLHTASGAEVARLLSREQPQMIAVVISHLPSRRAVEILEHLPSGLQADVIGRLVDLDEMDPDVLGDLETQLQSWISEQTRRRHRRQAGLEAVTAILEAGGTRFEQTVRLNLARHDEQLAEVINGPRPTFADLEMLDGDGWSVLLAAADPEVARLALVGASEALIQRLLDRLDPAEARRFKQNLDRLGPTRLSDIEAAQDALARLAQELDIRGRLRLRSAATLHVMG